MVRFMKINPKFKGGMIKTMKGLRPLIRKGVQAIRGSGVRPPIGQFKQLSMSSTVKPVMSGEGVKKQTYTKLKFLI
jgi:hypothetical protein